jgi:protein ImuA
LEQIENMQPFTLSLDLPARHLPENSLAGGGLAGGAIHEFRGCEGSAAHVAFAVLLLLGVPGNTPILWTGFSASCYPPGLAWLGLDPARCLFAQARDDAECLGTLETALRGGMAGVAEPRNLSRLAARRLALAAKQGNSIGFLLRNAPAFTATDSTAPATRWLVTPAPAVHSTTPLLRAELLYAKGGRPGVFFYEIKKEAEDAAPPALALVAATLVAERPAGPGQLRRAG